jgi:hypothetical protein
MVRDRPRNTSTIGPDPASPRLGRSGEDVGKQFWRSGRAHYLGRHRRSSRRPDGQIGPGHIQPGIEQAGDDADLPGIACRSATAKDQRSLAIDRHATQRKVRDALVRSGQVKPILADVV